MFKKRKVNSAFQNAENRREPVSAPTRELNSLIDLWNELISLAEAFLDEKKAKETNECGGKVRENLKAYRKPKVEVKI